MTPKYRQQAESIIRKRRLRPLVRRITFIVLFFLLIGLVCGISWFISSKKYEEFLYIVGEDFGVFTAAMGMNVEHIYIDGQHHLTIKQILEMLPFSTSENEAVPILTVDLEEIKQELYKNLWIKEVYLERQLPNSIHIIIREREPVAIWQLGGDLKLVDIEGFIIDNKKLGMFADLPIVVGEGANMQLPELLEIIKLSSNQKQRVESAIWVGNRRWNIRLDNNIEVKLPENTPISAWNRLMDIQDRERILDRTIKSIDMRVEDRLFISK